MPRVPSYQPNQVGPVRANEERQRAFDDGGGVLGAIGQGLGQLAGQASQRMVDLDERDAKNDDTQARQIAADKGLALSNMLAQYKTTNAGAARAGQQAFNTQSQEIWDNALKEATTPRMRGFVQQRLEGVYRSAQQQGFAHAIEGAQAERSMAFDATSASWAQQAVNTDDPEERDNLISSGVTSTLDKAREIGGIDLEANPQVGQQLALDYTSKVHGDVLDRMFAVADPQTDQIMDYAHKYEGQMTGALQTEVMKRLQGPIQERMAQSDNAAILSIYSGTKPQEAATQGGASGYMERIGDHEGGRKNPDTAKNPRSSATGRYQFTDGTWLNQYKKRYGETGLSDRQILVKRSDRDTQNALMGDLTRDNSAALTRANLPVDGGTLYLAHFAGSGGAVKVLKSDRDAKVGDVLGGRVTSANPFLRNWSVGQLTDWAAGVGGSEPVRNAPQEYDHVKLNDAIDKWATATGASPERVERARKQLDRHVSADEGLLRDQRSQADEAAANLVATKGDGFRTAQIPRSVWATLSPVQQRQYMDVEKKLLEPKDVKANGPEATTLDIMWRYDPDKFKSLNIPAQFAGKVTNEELKSMFVRQQDMIRKPPKAGPQFEPQTAISEAIGRGKNYHGVDLKDTDKPAVYDFMASWLKGQFEKNGKIGPNDADEAFKAATSIAIKRPGMLWGSTERKGYEVSVADIGDRVKTSIQSNFARAHGGRAPTDEEMLAVYRAMVPAKGL